MGIRLNIAIGYGLDLTNLNKDSLVYANDIIENKDRFDAFIQDCRESAEKAFDAIDRIILSDRIQASTFANIVIHDGEFGLPDKALLIPIGQEKEWRRYNDMIDYAILEANTDFTDKGKDPYEPLWLTKPGNLYPFYGLMRANPKEHLGVERYEIPCYLDNEETRSAIPLAPKHLWHAINHLELTGAVNSNPEAVTKAFLSLRPSVYRWFS